MKHLHFINNLRKKETLQHTAIVFILRFSGLILAYFLNIFIANSYGKEVYGNFVTALTFLEILTVFASLGLTELVIKLTADIDYSKNGNPVNTYFKKSILLVFFNSIFFSILFFLCSRRIAIHVFENENLIQFFETLAIFLPFYSLHLLITSYWQGANGFVKFGLFRFVFPYLFFFIGYFVFMDIENIFLLYMVAFSSLLFFEFFFIIKKLNIRNLSEISYKYLLKKSSPMMISSIVLFSLNWSDILMIGMLKGQDEVGNYQAAFKIASLTLLIILVSNIVVAPKISEMFSQNKIAVLFSFLRKVTKYTTILTLIISIPFLIFPGVVMNSFFGEAFKVSGPILIILSIANIINTFFGPIAQVMNMTKHQLAFQYITILTVLINIVLNIIFIEKYGALGCSMSTLISIFTLNIVGTMFIRKTYKKSFFAFSR